MWPCARSPWVLGVPFSRSARLVWSVQRYNFSQNKQTFRQFFHSEHGVLFVEHLKNAIFKPSERISAPKYRINPQRSRKSKFDPFLNVWAVINGIGSSEAGICHSKAIRTAAISPALGSMAYQCRTHSEANKVLLHQYRRWCATCFGRRT